MDKHREAARKVLTALYRYETMTPHQLAVTLNYSINHIYKTLSRMKESIEQVPVPFIAPSAKAYYLAAQTAADTADHLREDFDKKDWQDPTKNMLQTLTANQFMTELIQQTSKEENAGLLEWYGPRGSAEKYAVFDQEENKTFPVRPLCYGSFQQEDTGRMIFNLEVLTGEEIIPNLEDQVKKYIKAAKNFWGEDVKHFCILFVSHSPAMVEKVISVWNNTADRIPGDKPQVGAAYFQDIVSKGIFGRIWLTPEQQVVNINYFEQFPPQKIAVEFLGKQMQNRFSAFKPLLGKSKKQEDDQSMKRVQIETKQNNTLESELKYDKSPPEQDLNWLTGE